MNKRLGDGREGAFTTLGGTLRQPGDESSRRFGTFFFIDGKRILQESLPVAAQEVVNGRRREPPPIFETIDP